MGVGGGAHADDVLGFLERNRVVGQIDAALGVDVDPRRHGRTEPQITQEVAKVDALIRSQDGTKKLRPSYHEFLQQPSVRFAKEAAR